MCECAARTCYACTQLSRSSPGSPRKQNLHGKTTEVHAKVRGSTGRLQTRQHAERCRLDQCYCARSTLIGGAALSKPSRAAARFDRGCGARSWCPTAEREVYAMLVDMAKGVASKTFFQNSRRLVRAWQAVGHAITPGISLPLPQWVSAKSVGDVPRKSNTVRRYLLAARGIGRCVFRFGASGDARCSGGNEGPQPYRPPMHRCPARPETFRTAAPDRSREGR